MNRRLTAFAGLRRPMIGLGMVLLLLAAAFGAIEAARISLENSYRETLDNEVKRRAVEVMARTLNGNVMGSVAALGLVNQPMKQVARKELPLQDPGVMEILQAVGKAYQANGVYVVNREGIIQSCWYTMGVTLTGVDIKFRPYFQIAMQGKQNIYAAIGTTTGQRSLYFAAPLYGGISTSAPVIGATVARLDLERVDSVLKSWPGPALLLSPQQITFASNRSDWVEQMAGERTPEQLQVIRALKQFGHTFDKGTPKVLPFDIDHDKVAVDGRRYAVAKAPVQWNDPNGEWTLVLLGNLDELMPLALQVKIGAATSTAILVLSGLLTFWRRRLQRSEAKRRQAEVELKEYTGKLEFESALKSRLAQLSTALQQTGAFAEFGRVFLFHAMPLLGADYGVIYVLDEETRRLKPVGGHGVATGELEDVAIGQGLVGQCARDGRPVVIASPAGNDIRIVWGCGETMPKTLILQPIVQTGRLLGVVVLATLRPHGADQQTTLDMLMPMLAMNLEILMRNLNAARQVEMLKREQATFQEALPDMPDEALNLAELVDLDKLQTLFSNFCESVGVAAAIIDLEGKVLASSRWQRACTDFHRVNPSTCARCIECDTGLALKLKEGESFTMYRCSNGMTDCASPIIVEGQHLANVFIGQFHVGQPDLDFFRQQAQEFGFPQEEYLKAISDAPVLDEKKLPLILGFLTGFTNMVTSLSMERRRADVAQRTLQGRAEELFKQRLAAMEDVR